MSTCLDISQIYASSSRRIEELKHAAAAHPDVNMPGVCEAFSSKVRMVESAIMYTYALCVEKAKCEEDLGNVVNAWQGMNEICDAALFLVRGLKESYPYCGTHELYNLLLDYKNASVSRYKDAKEELECQTIQIPGLFQPMR